MESQAGEHVMSTQTAVVSVIKRKRKGKKKYTNKVIITLHNGTFVARPHTYVACARMARENEETKVDAL